MSPTTRASGDTLSARTDQNAVPLVGFNPFAAPSPSRDPCRTIAARGDGLGDEIPTVYAPERRVPQTHRRIEVLLPATLVAALDQDTTRLDRWISRSKVVGVAIPHYLNDGGAPARIGDQGPE